MVDSEVWKDVAGYEGLYQVSNKGNVYSVERINSQRRKWGGYTLKLSIDKIGYPRVNLYKDGRNKNVTVHRLVANAFLPNPNNYPEINHQDEDKTNNNVENLEWCTRKYNINHGTRTKRMANTNNNPVKCVHEETGEEIYLKSMAEGALYGFNPKRISDVCLGKQHIHRGYSFQKIEKRRIEL